LSDDRSGGMSVWLQSGEGDGGNDWEKDFSAEPNNEG